MAAYGFKGIGWFLCGVVVAPACYLVSSQVAAERGRLEAVDQAIVKARKDIRTLETEFETRGNLAQLERWNGDVMALAAPSPAQFLVDEAQLASLMPLGDAGEGRIRHADYVVPAGNPVPVTVIAAAVPAPVVGAVQAAQGVKAEAVGAAANRLKGQAVAMLDDKLLSDSTLGDLMKGAKAELSVH